MKFLTYEQDGMQGLAIDADAGFVGLTSDEAAFPAI